MGPRTLACSPRPAHPHRPGVVHLPAHGLVAQLLHEVELLLRGSGGGGDGGDDDDDDCPGPWLRPRRVTSSSAVRQPLPGWVGSGRVGSGEEPQALGSAQRGLRLRGPSLWLPDAPAAQSGPLASRGSAAWCPHGPLGPRCHFAQRSPAPGIFNSLSRLDLKHKVEKADTKSVDRRTHHRWRPRTSKTHPRD